MVILEKRSAQMAAYGQDIPLVDLIDDTFWFGKDVSCLGGVGVA